ncbi:MFS transporter [Deinococcus sp. Arct2-2]|uniref:MFS transporter n=1 Tax=Deinococcus sp. Arct2-2 TaxID=2568653 RepID=UPI0010A50979|nr:MFS transporter [Deinococcus sp. Arct2-2]THF67836.1 MFS transporter [Deinococcus sp. Arct2-2]
MTHLTSFSIASSELIPRIWGLFFLNGLLFSSWAVQIPAVQERFSLGPLHLSGLLFTLVVGNVAALAPVGWLMQRWGVRATLLLSVVAMALGLIGLPLSPSLPLVVLSLLVYGLGFGGADLVLNATGTWLEDQVHHPIMSGFHAAFSMGALAGGLLGGLLLTRGVSLLHHLGGVSLLVGLAGSVLALQFPRRVLTQPTLSGRERPSVLLGLLLLVGFSAALCEGAVNDWAAVYVRGVLNAPASSASLGFTSFALMMVVGRVCGNRLCAVLGRGRLATGAALLATAGFVGVQWAGTVPSLVLLGFALVGLGLSVLAPLGFSAAWQLGQARGVALMTAVFYGGFLAGPPLVGVVVHASTLKAAFALPLLLALVCAALSAGLKVFAEPDPDVPLPA